MTTMGGCHFSFGIDSQSHTHFILYSKYSTLKLIKKEGFSTFKDTKNPDLIDAEKKFS